MIWYWIIGRSLAIDLCGYINHEFDKYLYGCFFYDIEGIFGAFYRFIFTCFASALKIGGICIVDLNIDLLILKIKYSKSNICKLNLV